LRCQAGCSDEFEFAMKSDIFREDNVVFKVDRVASTWI
jgi:hypothetical protein